jgi:hypothetical protein
MPHPAAPTTVPWAARPLRASEVHDSKVRRNAAITPDMVYPNPHDLRLGESPRRARISDNIANRTRRVQSPDRERESCHQKMRDYVTGRATF